MPFLNSVARSPPSPTLVVGLPAGTVSRGSGALSIPSGLTVRLQGHGKDGEGKTILDLQQQNLDLGAMLGDTGRMEFSGIHVTNVRALRRCAAVHKSCVTLPCAQGSAVFLLAQRLRSTFSQCRADCLGVCLFAVWWFASVLCALPSRTRVHAHDAVHAHVRSHTCEHTRHTAAESDMKDLDHPSDAS